MSVVAGVAAQTWFVPGTSLAGGDLTPPVGTAWIARLFEPWVWSGNSLGGPNTTTTQAPWAVIDLFVHVLGGSGALAQRCWLTSLFIGAALAGYWLLRVLRMSVTGASIGAMVWVFNPYVVSVVGVNDVYLAALVLVPIWPAIVLRVVEGRWKHRHAFVAFALSAPIAGFVYQNPPLVGLAAIGALVAAVAPGIGTGGGRALRIGAITLGMGMVVVGLASAYWLVPALEELRHTSSSLSSVGSWAWTEHRASIANGFWLNTTWGWVYPAYYPFAPLYSKFPLDILRFILPATAFGSLGVLPVSDRRRLRVAGGAAFVCLFTIVFGTGTNLPGSIVFDPVYHLPLGWLFREPGRFLMATALGYAVLVGTGIDAVWEWASRRATGAWPWRTPKVPQRAQWASLASFGCVLVALATAFPLAGGALDPTYRLSVPASHVRVPKYWEQLASWVNRSHPRATILVLPPDDFYQMPYTWGYYGSDGFIANLLRARILDPAGEGYAPASSELLRVDDQFAGALVEHRWQLASDLATALGVNEILVRGDVNAEYPGRSITSPALLATALQADPLTRSIFTKGPLELFQLLTKSSREPTTVVPVTDNRPDLAVLGNLPADTALVSGPSRPGVLFVRFIRLLKASSAGKISEVLNLPRGWRYHAVVLPELASRGLGGSEGKSLPSPVTLSQRPMGEGRSAVAITVNNGESLIENGTFSSGPWAPVGNCDAVPGTTATADLSLEVLRHGGPKGLPALELGASADRACEAEKLRWQGGPFLLTFDYRAVRGPAPSICLWEVGPDRCANTPSLADKSSWSTYSVEISPRAGTKAVILFLYATPGLPKHRAVDEYARVEVHAFPDGGTLAIIGKPVHSTRKIRIEVSTVGVGNAWVGPAGARPVRVDGVRLGWILGPGERLILPQYPRAVWFDAGWILSGISLAVASGCGLLMLLGARRLTILPLAGDLVEEVGMPVVTDVDGSLQC